MQAVPRLTRGYDVAFAVAVVVILAVKVYILATFWNDRLGDYGRLEAFANFILSSSAWLHDGGINREGLPPEIWKTPGYPLLIAGVKLLLGDSWAKGLMIFATIMSLIAGLYVRQLALALNLGPVVAAVAFLLFEFSVPASTDVLVMPDGLYGSVATIVVCAAGIRFITAGEVSIRLMLVCGCAIAACFFIREGFLYLVVPLGLALVLPMWWVGVPRARAAALLLVFLLPTVITAAGIYSWNRYRTGHFMLAMVSEIVFLIGALKTAEKDPTVFGGDGLLDRVARASFSDYDYGDAQKITERMFREHGVKAPELYRLAQRKFLQAVFEHPQAYVLSMADRFRFAQQASMAGDLLMRLDDLEYWRHVVYHFDYHGGWRASAARLKDTRDLTLLTPDLAAQIVPRVVTRAASIAMFLVFVFGLPVLALSVLRHARPKSGDRRVAVLLLALYALYWAVLAIYMLVSVEVRYMGPICAFPILGSLVVLTHALSRRSRTAQPA